MKLQQLGPYRIVKQIGKGGMGAVYEAARDGSSPSAGERVAIKALSPQLAMAEGFRERFEAEIESLKKLKHAGIVRLYGYGEQDGVLFYSMELVDGPSLEEEIHRGRKFDWQETLEIGIQVCQALKHAHDHGVVHRDIKPANLMLTADNQIKIADFGIARLFGGTQLTTAGGVLGTADYMSPEQADGRPVTEKCDQYSLGGVMYSLLAGRPPFRAKTMPEMLQLQRFAEPEPVRRYAVDTPDQLDRLISQLLAKEPAERFPNVLVLSRHMKAMKNALSRPAKPDSREESPTAARPAGPSNITVGPNDSASQTVEAPYVLHDKSLDTDAKSNLYDAATLDQPNESDSIIANSASLVAGNTDETAKIPASLSTHFTTVDEDARRQRQQQQGNRSAMLAQLAGLLAALGLLIWGGWQLMKPATADQLFDSILVAIDKDGIRDPSRETIQDVDAFFDRYSSDPRAQELQPLKNQLEFLKYEKRARARLRFGGDASLKPIEQIYFNALDIAADNPAEAIPMLRALVALYDPANRVATLEAARSLTTEFSDLGDPRLLVAARQRIEQFVEQIKEVAASQLPVVRARLDEAANLRESEPARAKLMYQAIVKLYSKKVWARDVVGHAKAELMNLE